MTGGTGTTATLLHPGYLKIELRGGIGETIHFEDVRKSLVANWNAVSLMVVIDSGGGLVSESDKLYAVIRSHPAEHKIAIVETAASAAVKVALACSRRWARHDARLMIHRIAAAPRNSRWTATMHEETARRLQNSDAEMAAFYAARAGKASAGWFLRQMQDDQPMSLMTALECGLIHRVLDAPTKSPSPVARPATHMPAAQQPRQGFPYLTRDMRVSGV